MIRHSVEHALYEGARAGIIPGATATDVQNRARSVLRTVGLARFNVEVTPAVLKKSIRDFSARIQLPLDQNLFAPAFFFRGRTLERTLSMQREGTNEVCSRLVLLIHLNTVVKPVTLYVKL